MVSFVFVYSQHFRFPDRVLPMPIWRLTCKTSAVRLILVSSPDLPWRSDGSSIVTDRNDTQRAALLRNSPVWYGEWAISTNFNATDEFMGKWADAQKLKYSESSGWLVCVPCALPPSIIPLFLSRIKSSKLIYHFLT
jgi:hypothetical protein